MAYVTIKDVAREAGVSVPTVSQILNDTGRISASTRQKVQAAIERLGYIPNSAARSMRSSSTKTIGLLVPDLRNSYFAYLISAVTEQLARSGYVCLIGSSSESVTGQDTFLRTLLSQRIDGAIIVPQGKPSATLLEFLGAGFPVVFLDRRVETATDPDRTGPDRPDDRAGQSAVTSSKPGRRPVPANPSGLLGPTGPLGSTGPLSPGESICPTDPARPSGPADSVYSGIPLIDSDPLPGMADALATARSLGHRRIGFVHGPVTGTANLQERQDVFVRIGAALLGARDTLVAQSTEPFEAITELQTAGVHTFVFGYSPDALAGIRYFRQQGLIIGQDVSVISFDDIPFFELTTPAISIISQQLETMGSQGAKTLLSLLDGQTDSPAKAPRQTGLRIPTQFISRQSVLDKRKSLPATAS